MATATAPRGANILTAQALAAKAQPPASGPLAAVPAMLNTIRQAGAALPAAASEEDTPEHVTDALAEVSKAVTAAASRLGALATNLNGARAAAGKANVRQAFRLADDLAERETPKTGWLGMGDRAAAVQLRKAELQKKVIDDVIGQIERDKGPDVARAAKGVLDAIDILKTARDDFSAALDRPDAVALTSEDRDAVRILRDEYESLSIEEVYGYYENLYSRILRAQQAGNTARVQKLSREDLLFRAAVRPMLGRAVRPPGVRVVGGGLPTTKEAALASKLIRAFRARRGEQAAPLLEAIDEIVARVERCFVLLAGRDPTYRGPGEVKIDFAAPGVASSFTICQYDAACIRRMLWRDDQISFDPWRASLLTKLNPKVNPKGATK